MQRAQHEHMLQAQEAALQAAVMAENPLDAMPMGVVTFCNWGGCGTVFVVRLFFYFVARVVSSLLKISRQNDRPPSLSTYIKSL